MTKRIIALFLLVIVVGMVLSSCVTRPRFSDYVGLERGEAIAELDHLKTSNTIKLVLNWLLWGPFCAWIPSIVDTINVISFADDFRTVENRIRATPYGAKVGQ